MIHTDHNIHIDCTSKPGLTYYIVWGSVQKRVPNVPHDHSIFINSESATCSSLKASSLQPKRGDSPRLEGSESDIRRNDAEPMRYAADDEV